MPTLRRKLLLTTVLVLALLGAMGFLMGTMVSSEVERGVQERIRTGVAAHVSQQASFWLRDLEFQPGNNTTLASLGAFSRDLGHPDVVALEAWSPDLKPVYGTGKGTESGLREALGGRSVLQLDPPASDAEAAKRAYRHTAGVYLPVMAEGRQVVGLLRATVRMDAAQQEILFWKTLLWGTLGILLVLLGAVLVSLQLFLDRSVVRPLRLLRGAAERVGRGSLKERVHVETRDELGDVARAFNTMVSKLQGAQEAQVQGEKLAAIGQLAAGVAHEINNPLTSILAYVSTVRSRVGDNPAALEALQGIDEAGQRCAHIVHSLLDYSRPSRKERYPIVLRDLLEQAAAEVRPRLGGRIRLEVDCPADAPPFQGEPHELRQVLANLLTNGVEAMPQGGALRLSGALVDGTVAITVADTGPGIPAEQRSRVFEPFFTTKPRGVGLGLAITHRIVQNHQGRIEVESAPGQGTMFRILIPREGPAGEIPTPPSASTPLSFGSITQEVAQARSEFGVSGGKPGAPALPTSPPQPAGPTLPIPATSLRDVAAGSPPVPPATSLRDVAAREPGLEELRSSLREAVADEFSELESKVDRVSGALETLGDRLSAQEALSPTLDRSLQEIRAQLEDRVRYLREEELHRLAGEMSAIREEAAQTRLQMDNLPVRLAREIETGLEPKVRTLALQEISARREAAAAVPAPRNTAADEALLKLTEAMSAMVARGETRPPPPPEAPEKTPGKLLSEVEERLERRLDAFEQRFAGVLEGAEARWGETRERLDGMARSRERALAALEERRRRADTRRSTRAAGERLLALQERVDEVVRGLDSSPKPAPPSKRRPR